MKKSGTSAVATCLATIIVGILLTLASALLLMLAWNVSLVPLIHIQRLTYPMALGLVFIVSVVGSVLRGGKK